MPERHPGVETYAALDAGLRSAGDLWVSALIAALPIIFFFVALAVLRMKGHIAATITVAIALAVAILFYKMPVNQALASAGYGFIYGLWPIAWIILTAVFLYKARSRPASSTSSAPQ